MSPHELQLSAKVIPRPEAKTLRVSDLLEHAIAGQIRVPDFQRPLRWRGTHVRSLFDSVYQGYPIGVLLFSRRAAMAEEVRLGAWTTRAASSQDAWFVVDGQQRVTALVSALLHPRRAPRQGPFAVWFDLEKETFERVTDGDAPTHWIPLNVVRDLTSLGEWLDEWSLRKERPDLAKRARNLQKAILDYTIPVWLVGDDNEVARRIFHRVNTNGVQMKEEEVFEAFLARGERRPLDAARRRVHGATGFGLFSAGLYLRIVKAVHGVDAKSTARDLDREEALHGAEVIQDTERALLLAIECVREDARIPDAAVMPYRSPPLILLSRFFAMHPGATPRTRVLLARWLWRSALSGDHVTASQGMINGAQRLIDADEHASVEALLRAASIPSSFPTASLTWNPSNAQVRACMAAMLAAAPSEDDGGDAMGEVDDDEPGADPMQARFVGLRGQRPERVVEAFVAVEGEAPQLMHLDAAARRGQFVTDAALAAFARGDTHEFYALREREMTARMERFFRLRCGIGETDRIAISAIEARVEASFRT